jgi:hypothetical protein
MCGEMRKQKYGKISLAPFYNYGYDAADEKKGKNHLSAMFANRGEWRNSLPNQARNRDVANNDLVLLRQEKLSDKIQVVSIAKQAYRKVNGTLHDKDVLMTKNLPRVTEEPHDEKNVTM